MHGICCSWADRFNPFGYDSVDVQQPPRPWKWSGRYLQPDVLDALIQLFTPWEVRFPLILWQLSVLTSMDAVSLFAIQSSGLGDHSGLIHPGAGFDFR